MSNKLKWTDWSSIGVESPRSESIASQACSARAQLAGCLLSLCVLAAVVPGPATWGSLLTEVTAGVAMSSPIGTAAEAAILVTAGVAVWSLLAWLVVVGAAAVLGRLPGAAGRPGRVVLQRIAPAAAARILVTAVGVSLIAGTSACAVPAMTTAGSSSPASTASGSPVAVSSGGGTATGVAAASELPGSSGVARPPPVVPDPVTGDTAANTAPPVDSANPVGTITIDWPDTAGPASGGTPPDPSALSTTAHHHSATHHSATHHSAIHDRAVVRRDGTDQHGTRQHHPSEHDSHRYRTGRGSGLPTAGWLHGLRRRRSRADSDLRRQS